MIKQKKVVVLSILLVLTLSLVGCNKEELSVLIVKVNTEAEVTLSQGDLSKTLVGKNVQFPEYPVGEYQLEVKAEGYEENIPQTILLEEGTKKVEVELTPEVKPEELVPAQEIKNLTLKFYDVNQNPLDVEVLLKKDDQLVAKGQGREVELKDVVVDKYSLIINKPGYQTISKPIDLAEVDEELPVYLLGGHVEQSVADREESIDKINQAISQLDDNEELIVALSYLNLNSKEPKFNLDNKLDQLAKIEYDARKRGTELVAKYGNEFLITQSNYSLGDSKEFVVNDDIQKDNVNATLEAKGDHIYLFVDNKTEVAPEKLDKLVAEFDRIIYPNLIKEEGNDKIVVLLTEFLETPVTGYFDPADLYADLGNQEKMFYLNPDRSMNTILAAAAHQYQHLSFFVDKAEAGRAINDAWIDQGLAQLAQRVCGYVDYEKEGWSSDQGNGWVYDQDYGYLNNTDKVNLLVHDGSLAFSGASSLFANYILEQYGSELLEEIGVSSIDPVEVIENYSGKEFTKVYLNWMTANIADQISNITSQVYKYNTFNLAAAPQFMEGPVVEDGIYYIKFDANDKVDSSLIDLNNQLAMVLIKKEK